ncbi:MAG: hypothetical protein IJT44_13005 [Clostridia bacterium]|nr:hypothetical protein [Clostridia bacterium]
MIEISEALQILIDSLKDPAAKAGFSLYFPQGAPRGETPVCMERDTQFVSFAGDGSTLRIELTGNTVGLFYAESAPDVAQKGDFTRLSLSLLEPETAEVRDVKYIADEFIETLESKFSAGKKPQAKKLPGAVSKAAVRSGAFYDLPSFGNRFTATYPELRAAFRENIDTYGEFLAEDFFGKYGTPLAMDVIRENNPQKMKKLFNLLNEMYDNGVNDVQSLIVVTILGEINNDETLLANCVDYMNEELCVNVIRVNKFLASSAGKTARMRLENPPRYKPKKEKKSNFLSSLMGGAGGGMGGMTN